MGKANPLGAILTAAMVLRHSAHLEAEAAAVEAGGATACWARGIARPIWRGVRRRRMRSPAQARWASWCTRRSPRRSIAANRCTPSIGLPMDFSHAKTRYLLVTGAILTASAIQLYRGYRPVIVVSAAWRFCSSATLSCIFRVRRNALFGASRSATTTRGKVCCLCTCSALLQRLRVARAAADRAAIPPKVKKEKRQPPDLEWMWQYSPPPADGREHELIRTRVSSVSDALLYRAAIVLGAAADGPKAPVHKSLADTVDDFLDDAGQGACG